MIPLADQYYEFGSYRLIPSSRLLLRAGTPVAITAKIFELLLILVERRGGLVERNFLMNMLWPDAIVEEGNLTQCIFVLRKTLGNEDAGTSFIRTEPGRGYCFVAPVRVYTERAEAPDQPQDWIQTISPTTSLAVLPLKTLSNEPSGQLLGAGIADAIIANLSREKRLIVRPTTAVLKYNGIGKDPALAGRELRVDLVLDGMLQQVGERVRVSVQLIKVSSGVTLWAERFDAAFTDVFAVQDAVSDQAAQALRLEISGRSEHRAENVEIYQLYIKGRYFWDKRSEEGLDRALECMRDAIRLDPGFARGWVGSADCCALLAEYLFRDPRTCFQEARAAAEMALSLNSELAEAHASLAEIHLFHDWDLAAAEREYKLATELNPNYSMAFLFYAWMLMTAGRHDEAFKKIQRAQRIDPGSLTLKTAMGLPYYYKGEYERAIGHYHQALEMNPAFEQAHYYFGESLIQLGQYDEAASVFRRHLPAHPQQSMALEAFAHARAGRESEAQQILQRLLELSAEQYISPYCLARTYVGLRQFDDALAQLERGLEERACWMIFLKVDPLLDELRAESRFATILEGVGFNG